MQVALVTIPKEIYVFLFFLTARHTPKGLSILSEVHSIMWQLIQFRFYLKYRPGLILGLLRSVLFR